MRLRSGRTSQIEEGATVRERQKIVSIMDFSGPMQINAKVPETVIEQVAPKMKARVQVDAFPNVTLHGVVRRSRPPARPLYLFDQGPKVYTTRIRIARGPAGLRPGMTAQAEILV